MLNEYQLFLSKRYIRPDLAEWSSTLAYIRSRLKQEVINLALGVAKGDEVEAQRDPQIQAAVRALNGGN
jgi:carboxyl-terminal processing protease